MKMNTKTKIKKNMYDGGYERMLKRMEKQDKWNNMEE